MIFGKIKRSGRNGQRWREFRCRRIILAEEEVLCRRKPQNITQRRPSTIPKQRSTIAKQPSTTTLATTRKQHTTLTPLAAMPRMRAPMARKRVKRTPKSTGRSKVSRGRSQLQLGATDERSLSILWLTSRFGFRLDCFFAFAIGLTYFSGPVWPRLLLHAVLSFGGPIGRPQARTSRPPRRRSCHGCRDGPAAVPPKER
jgi:hypothetical protein